DFAARINPDAGWGRAGSVERVRADEVSREPDQLVIRRAAPRSPDLRHHRDIADRGGFGCLSHPGAPRHESRSAGSAEIRVREQRAKGEGRRAKSKRDSLPLLWERAG